LTQIRRAAWRERKVCVVLCYPQVEPSEAGHAHRAADEADYQALQSEADLALAVLTRAQGQRVAMAQLAAD
jgi:hypothetical protein